MNEENVLVTGGCGFIGSHLTEKLLSLGHNVTVFDAIPLEEAKKKNLQGVKDHENLTFVHGDIRDKKALSKLITNDTDKIFHLSAIVGVKNYCIDPLKVIDVNVGGTRNVLELAQRHNVKILFTSTSEIYGKNPNIPWSEDYDRVLGSTCVDRWSYSTSKAVCEHMIFGIHRSTGLPATIVRYFNVYGPRQNPYYAVSQSIYKVLRNEQPLLYDGGRQTRCFTFVEDAIEGTVEAASSQKGNGEIFNIGNDRESTIYEVIKLIIKKSSKDIKWKNLDTKKHYGEIYEDITRRVPDVTKAKKLLGWQANTTLEEGIEKTIRWAKKNAWWLKHNKKYKGS